MNINNPNSYYQWFTQEEHPTNMDTMNDFLKNHLINGTILELDDTMAVVENDLGEKFELHASGDGDFNNHLIEVKPL